MTRLARLRPDELDGAQRAVYDGIIGGRRASQLLFAVRDVDGALTGPFNAMVHVPALGAPLSALGEAIRFNSELSDREREIAVLAVAAVCRASFEWYAHERVALAVGLQPEEIAGLQHPEDTALADEREDAIRQLAVLVVQGRDIGSARCHELGERVGVTTLIEVVVLVGYYRLLADLLRTFAVGVPEGPDPFREGDN